MAAEINNCQEIHQLVHTNNIIYNGYFLQGLYCVNFVVLDSEMAKLYFLFKTGKPGTMHKINNHR